MISDIWSRIHTKEFHREINPFLYLTRSICLLKPFTHILNLKLLHNTRVVVLVDVDSLVKGRPNNNLSPSEQFLGSISERNWSHLLSWLALLLSKPARGVKYLDRESWTMEIYS